MKMKKIVCMCLISTMLLSFYACGKSEEKPDTTTAVQTTANASSETQQTEEAEPEQPDIYADLPTGNFENDEFVFANELQSSSWAYLSLNFDTVSGAVLDDAIYHRNRNVEERLNIKISVAEFSNSTELIGAAERNLMSGDDPYDVYDIPADSASSLILKDCFVSTDALGLNLSKPWWNETVMNSLTYGDTCYSIAGDLSIMLWEASYALIYNKDMAEQLNLPDQYQLVRDGKFTLDSLNEAMIIAYQDNGNSTVDTEDTFGMTGNLRLMAYSMIAGGEDFVAQDANGLPVFEGMTDRMLEMYEKIFDVYFDNDSVFLANTMAFKDSSKDWHSLFIDGKALFYFEPIGAHVKLRNVSFDFGFLPMPKFDESQEEYITPIIQFAHTMHITKANKTIDRIGIVLENLAAESYKNVRSIYFETVIEGKRALDEESVEMFEIIFDNQVMNPMTIYGWGGFSNMLNSMALAGNRSIASRAAAYASRTQADIQNTANYYKQ